MAILGRFYTPDALAGDDYAFSASGVYYSPPPGPLDAYRAYVGGLPADDGPEVFGMHNNANIAFQRAETDGILKTALALQPRAGGGAGAGGKSSDEVVGELAADIEAHLPARLRTEDAGPSTFTYKGGHMDSLATVLSQEMVRFNTLLAVMAATLADLQRAIRGEILLSEELDRMYTALRNGAVPANWEAVAYPSLKPLGSWVKDLHARIAFMAGWLRHGQPPAFWLSGFFFPQGFMTGALQNHARKYAIPIDTLAFSFRVLAAAGPEQLPHEEVPSDGVLVHGLYLDGARWNAEARCIDDSRPGEIYAPMPLIHFTPARDYKPSPREYSAPVYKTSVRAGVLSTTGMSTNFVVAVELPSMADPAYWVLKGAALLCQLNE
jgi:dynein heavy chain